MGIRKRRLRSGKFSYNARITRNGRTYWSKAFPSRELAQIELGKMTSALHRGALEEEYGPETKRTRRTVVEAAREYLRHLEGENKPSTIARKEGILDRWTDRLDGRDLADISRIDIERYKRERRQDVSGASVNRELATLSHLMAWAVNVGYRSDNPVRGVQRYAEDSDCWRHLSKEEAETLLTACQEQRTRAPHLYLLVLAALYTGLRRGDLLSLQWDQVDLSRSEIRLTRAKTGTRTALPLHPRLHEALVAAETRGTYVFAHPDGARLQDPKRSFATAVRRAGLGKVRFHDLRHTFASWLVEQGVDLFTVQELMGHASLAMTRRYAHLTPRHKRDAIERLGGKPASVDTLTDTREKASRQG